MVFRGRDLELWGKMMIDCFYRVICLSIELFMYIFILGFDDMAFILSFGSALGKYSVWEIIIKMCHYQ